MGDTTAGTAAGGSGAREFSLESVLTVFRDRSDPARPLTANDVMEELDCSRRTAHNKLNALVEERVLATRKVGARGRVCDGGWLGREKVRLDPARGSALAVRVHADLDVDAFTDAVRSTLEPYGTTVERAAGIGLLSGWTRSV